MVNSRLSGMRRKIQVLRKHEASPIVSAVLLKGDCLARTAKGRIGTIDETCIRNTPDQRQKSLHAGASF